MVLAETVQPGEPFQGFLTAEPDRFKAVQSTPSTIADSAPPSGPLLADQNVQTSNSQGMQQQSSPVLMVAATLLRAAVLPPSDVEPNDHEPDHPFQTVSSSLLPSPEGQAPCEVNWPFSAPPSLYTPHCILQSPDQSSDTTSHADPLEMSLVCLIEITKVATCRTMSTGSSGAPAAISGWSAAVSSGSTAVGGPSDTVSGCPITAGSCFATAGCHLATYGGLSMNGSGHRTAGNGCFTASSGGRSTGDCHWQQWVVCQWW